MKTSEPEKTQTTRIEQPTRNPRLVALWDGGSESSFLPEQGRCVIGRGHDADVVIDQTSVSRRHAALDIGEGTVTWEDLGSANGTKVRGRLLAPGERVRVGFGEPVEVGSIVVIVRPPGDRPALGHAPTPLGTEPLADVERWIQLVANTDISVLMLGETGVGKGFFARQVHERSGRASGPFVHINCAALPEHLLESELFGYERGAFTGAVQAKQGLLESANQGTVFMDEIGELPLATQAKLLVALERREVTRVGGLKPRTFDVRFVAATNRDIEETVARGAFRQDLYYRLAGLPIVIPPLRDRRSEIPRLASMFLAEAARRMRRPEPSITEAAMALLCSHDWPGNVRELMMVLERALLITEGALTASDIESSMRPMAPTPSTRGFHAPPPPLSSPMAAPPPPSDEDHGPTSTEERARVLAALEECAGNQSRAAKLLGISRRTLIHRIEAFGLPRPRK